MTKGYQTLHAHTVNSDGQLTHEEVLATCERLKLGAVAFTDHDALINKNNFSMLKNYNGNVKWISGIEISSGLPKELGSKASSELHIVGLFINPFNKNLMEHSKKALDARITRMQSIVKNLKGIGFDISEADCLKASEGESVGRPHIVKALLSKEVNIDNQEKIRLKMELEAKKNENIQKKYDYMMEQGSHQYPYMLYLSDDSYIPGIYVDYLYFLDMDKSVEIIRNAGGVAILAHYFTCVKKINYAMLDKFFKENRLDGAETTYGLFGLENDTQIKKDIVETSMMAFDLVEKNHKLHSGGADAHKIEDFEDFAKSEEYGIKTIGLAEKMIESGKVNKEFSNY